MNRRRMYPRRMVVTNLLCECSTPHTRDGDTPQQCRRCGSRIDRSYDFEIDDSVAAPKIS